MNTIDFLVRKHHLTTTERRETPARALEEGHVRLSVDKFALTANNITYAAFGDAMNYWGFYPAEGGWGHIPVWGFGSVLESRCHGVAVGEKFYGYYPMSSKACFTAGLWPWVWRWGPCSSAREFRSAS